MQLWSDEIDAMRDEARQVVAAGMAAMAETIEAMGTPPTDRQARVQQYRDLQALSYSAVPEAEVREIAGVPCRVFRPDGPATAIYLHFHGGGMMMGAPEMNDAGNLERSRRHGMAVVSVDYRLAPEHPFPAGPDDGIAVTRWLLDNGGAEFGSERLLIGGESAGGYMAAAVLLRIRDELGAIDRVAGANLAYGLHDWGRSPSQRGLRAHEASRHAQPRGHRVLRRVLPAGSVRGGAPRPRCLARVRGPARAARRRCSASARATTCSTTRSCWHRAGLRSTATPQLFVAPDMPHEFPGFPCGITTAWSTRTNEWIAARL